MMFKSVGRIISEALEPLANDLEVDVNHAGTYGVKFLSPEDKDACAANDLSRRIVAAAKRMSKQAEKSLSYATSSLFENLPVALPVGVDGSKIKPIAKMTKGEAEWVINIREKQIEDDKKSVRAMKRLYKRALPYWSKNPTASWGECLLYASGAANDNIPAKVAA